MKGKGLFLSTFVLVFLAELGDKTQIASFSMAVKHGSLFSVILGGGLALVTSSFIAVTLGYKLAAKLPKNLLSIISGVLFLATGIYTLVRSLGLI